MKKNHDTASLNTMRRVFEHKLIMARQAVNAQILEVKASRDELHERENKVQTLRNRLNDNIQYLSDGNGQKSADTIEASLRYRHWVNYDMERESYYVELTRQELVEKQAELKTRLKMVHKINGKIDSVKSLSHTASLHVDLINEEAIAEEMSGNQVNRSGYV